MRQQPKWSTGVFVAAGAVAALAMAGCGGSTDSAAQQKPPDGTQNYADLQKLHAAVIDAGVDCGPLDVAEGTGLASAQGSCELGGDRLLLQLWDDATHRDDDTTTILINGGTDCYVLGRGDGDEGAWSVDAGADADVCHQLGDELGGEIFETEDDPEPSGPPPAPTYTLADLQSMAGTPCPTPGATAQAPDSTIGYSTSALEVGLLCADGTWSIRGEPLGPCEFLYEDLPYATADQQRLACVDGGLFLDGQTRTGPLYVGDYLVGTGTGQVPPGTYVATDVEGCYWERLDSAGNIIDNNFINAAPRAEFTVRASDYAININGCGGWMLAGS